MTGDESFVKDGKINDIGKTYSAMESFDGVEISKSGDKQVHLMAINESFFPNVASDTYSRSEVTSSGKTVTSEYDLSDLTKIVYHQFKAHIEDRTGDADKDHKKFGESTFKGYIRPNSPMDTFEKQLIKAVRTLNEKNIMKKNKILFFLMLICMNFVKAQDLKLFTPILISDTKSIMINGEMNNQAIVDYFNPDFNKMRKEVLKYSSDSDALNLYDSESNSYKPFLFLNKKNKEIVSTKNNFGVFRSFNLIKKNDRFFEAVSSTGSYPSHFERIKSIEILEKSKKFLIIKINYSDIYGYKGYSVLVLQDYKYVK